VIVSFKSAETEALANGGVSIRVNDQFRVCFRWTASGAEDVEIVDYH
jgi:plasmid maintenance system killer protein